MQKDTGELLKELALCADFSNFYHENEKSMVTESLPRLLDDLMTAKGLSKSAIIKASELSEVYAYQIFSGLRRPERAKLLSLAVGMRLTPDEVQQLLKSGGYPPLYVKRPFDSVVLYGLAKQLSVVEINELLFEYDLETLG